MLLIRKIDPGCYMVNEGICIICYINLDRNISRGIDNTIVCYSGLLFVNDEIKGFCITVGNIKIQRTCSARRISVGIELDGRELDGIRGLSLCCIDQSSGRIILIRTVEIELIIFCFGNDGSILFDVCLRGILFRKSLAGREMYLSFFIVRSSLTSAGIDVMPFGIIFHVTT